jgi:hypothetical protein
MNELLAEPRFTDYLGTLNMNRDYANYITEKLIKSGRENNLSPAIGAADIMEIEDLFIEIIGKIRKLNAGA